MKDFAHLNSTYLNYLTPLIKWRVMDIESLRRNCTSELKYKNFHRIIRNLEKRNILEGYRDPFTRKKYVYLGPLGEKELGLQENPTALVRETLIHDIRVSEISKAFLERGWITQVELEHELHDKRNFKTTYKIIPDALLHGTRRGVNFRMALEVELTRKNNQRIVEKARQYSDSTYYDYVMYIFSKETLMDNYMTILKEALGANGLLRFMFFCSNNLTGNLNRFDELEGVFKGEKTTIQKLLMSG